MHTLFRSSHLLIVGATLFVVATASAQTVRYDPNKDPDLIATREALGRAIPLTRQARACLRERKLIEAERLASDAVAILQEVRGACPEGHGILAEIWLLRDQPKRALLELGGESVPVDEVPYDRHFFTRALALVRLDRLAEAHELLSTRISNEGGVTVNVSPHIWAHKPLYPMHRAKTAAAIAATAYLLRGQNNASSHSPENFEDLREAIRLAPDSALAHDQLSLQLSDIGRHDDALVEAERAKACATGWEIEAYAKRYDDLRRGMERRRKQPTGG